MSQGNGIIKNKTAQYMSSWKLLQKTSLSKSFIKRGTKEHALFIYLFVIEKQINEKQVIDLGRYGVCL